MAVNVKWETFYTDSDKGDDYVNMISIDVANKRYILDEDITYLAVDGVYEDGECYGATYVSGSVFGIIVAGVKQKRFVRFTQAQ